MNHRKKIDKAIQGFTESKDSDMLVMVAKNLNFLERILFRPTIENICRDTKIPFLVIHERDLMNIMIYEGYPT